MTDDEILVQKIKEPSKVKYILPLKKSESEEEKLIKGFLMLPYANPHRYTVAMEGRPFCALVVMNNGLRYQATMTRLLNLDWYDVFNEQKKLEQNPGYGNVAPQFQAGPIIDLNSPKHALILHPLHQMARIEDKDMLEVRWAPDVDIANANPFDIMGMAVGLGSFRGLNSSNRFFIHYPPHMLKLFKAIQKEYEKFRQLGTLGKTIYTVFDPTKPSRGTMHPLGKADEEYGIRAIRYVNPNNYPKELGRCQPSVMSLPFQGKMRN